MEILLANDIVTNAITPHRRSATVSNAVDLAIRIGRVWVYTARADDICRALAGFTNDDENVTQILTQFMFGKNWLTTLSEDMEYINVSDAGRSQLLHGFSRLGEGAVLITDDQQLISHCPNAIESARFVQVYCERRKEIDFIDLKTQQTRIRSGLERRLDDVLRHGRYIMGPEVAELEEKLGSYVKVKHAITVSSGTDSLLIAMLAFGIGANDEVITVPYTWISTAEMIALLGAKPVFVDIDPVTFNMDANQVESAITHRTKAIMPVSIYGQCPDMDEINGIAQRHGLPVIEDAAQSFGAKYRGRSSCGLSTIGSTSFFPSKPLGCYGDGGALFTNDDELANRMRQIRVHGQSQKHNHLRIGINGRLDSIQAAILLSKFEQFNEECDARRQVADQYSSIFEAEVNDHLQSDEIRLPKIADFNLSVYAQYTVLIKNRDSVCDHLARAGVPFASYYVVPLHLQPAFGYLGHSVGVFPHSETVANHCLSLPMSPWMSTEEVKFVVQSVGDAVARVCRQRAPGRP